MIVKISQGVVTDLVLSYFEQTHKSFLALKMMPLFAD